MYVVRSWLLLVYTPRGSVLETSTDDVSERCPSIRRNGAGVSRAPIRGVVALCTCAFGGGNAP